MGTQSGDAFGMELVEPSSARFDVGDKANLFQHLEVLRNGRTGDGQGMRQLIDGNGARGKLLEDGHARGISQGIKAGL